MYDTGDPQEIDLCQTPATLLFWQVMKHRISYSDHVLEGQAVPVEAGARKVLLVRSAEGLFALENACPHQCKSMEQGEVLARSIRCPFHGVEIDLVDGSIFSDAGFIGLSSVQVFKVEEAEGDVYLEIRQYGTWLACSAQCWSLRGTYRENGLDPCLTKASCISS